MRWEKISRNFLSSKYSILRRVTGSTKYEGSGDDTPYRPMKVTDMRKGPSPARTKSLIGGRASGSGGGSSPRREVSSSSAWLRKERGGRTAATSAGGNPRLFKVSNRMGSERKSSPVPRADFPRNNCSSR